MKAKATAATDEKIHAIPQYKKDIVTKLAKQMKDSRTVLIASCRGLPSRQFHDIKKKLRGTADIGVGKKSAVTRALDAVGKGSLLQLKDKIQADVVVFFSSMEPFELASLLLDSQSSTKAKAGDIAPEDLVVEPGPTELVAGPAISELAAVGLKVAVKEGKLEIIKGATVTKKGDAISANVAGVLSKLNVAPMKVGFLPIAAYDAQADKAYLTISIDKKGAYEALKEAITKSLAFAVGRDYYTKETISFFLARASSHEKALAAKVHSHNHKEGA